MQAKAWASYELEKIAQEQAQDLIDDLLSGDVEIAGNLKVLGDVSFVSDCSIDGDLDVSGMASFSDISVTGDASVGGSVTATGLAITGNVYQDGQVGSMKKIYWHTVRFQRGGTAETSTYYRMFGNMIILSNSATSLTLTSFLALLQTEGFYGIVINGKYSTTPASDLQNMDKTIVALRYNPLESQFSVIYLNANNEEVSEPISTSASGWALFEDLGANAIN